MPPTFSFRRTVLLGLLLASTLATATATARVWTPLEGQPFEAEFERFFGGLVLLRTPSGHERHFWPRELNTADRKRLPQLRIEKAGGPPGDELRIQAVGNWQEYRDGNGKPIRSFRLRLETASKLTAAATSIGAFRIDESASDLGTSLKLLKYESDPTRFAHLTRYGCADQPTTGLEHNLGFEVQERPIKSIVRLRGSFEITTGERFEILVPKFAEKKDFTLQDTRLADASVLVVLNPSNNGNGPSPEMSLGGLEIILNRPKTFRVETHGDDRRIAVVELLEADGSVCYECSDGSVSSISQATRYFHFESRPPADLQLRLVVLKTIKTTRVPFELTDIKIPPPPWESAQQARD